MLYYKGQGYWSEMKCDRNRPEHPAHVWNGEYTLYGPYLCIIHKHDNN